MDPKNYNKNTLAFLCKMHLKFIEATSQLTWHGTWQQVKIDVLTSVHHLEIDGSYVQWSPYCLSVPPGRYLTCIDALMHAPVDVLTCIVKQVFYLGESPFKIFLKKKI